MMNIENIRVNAESPELVSWLRESQEIVNRYFAANFPFSIVRVLEVSFTPRFVKVWSAENGKRVRIHAFIDRASGDVLKPASCKAPAKHARGNLFDAQNGLGSMGPWGPVYLK